MSRQGPRSSKKQKRDDTSDSHGSDDDDDLQPIHFFVPGENINAAVLVEYITQYVDRTAKITSSHHPTDKTRTGFNILATTPLNSVSLRDIINDSRDWDLESQGKKFRKNPYRYSDSDTARRRAQQGATKGGTARPSAIQQWGSSGGRAEDNGREEPAVPPRTSNMADQHRQHQSPQPFDFPQQATPGYFLAPSRSDYVANTYNIYNTMPPTSYSSNPPTTGATYMPMPSYTSTTYPSVPKADPDYPPPSYEQSGTRGPQRPPPLPPSQPDPDTFDREDEAETTQKTDVFSPRATLSPGEDPSLPHSSQSRESSDYAELNRTSSHREWRWMEQDSVGRDDGMS